MTRTKHGCFGKYRGKVENNVDPLSLGRLQVSCPAVLGEGTLSWALPCTPFAGPGVGLFVLPPRGANVWVEFEGGDPDYPIWGGCFWGAGEVPASPAMEHIKMLKTDGVSITINDMQNAGGLTMLIESPAVQNPISLKCDTKGVELTIGDAKLTMTTEDIVTAFGGDASTRLSGTGLELAGKKNTSVFDDKGIVSTGAEHTITFSESGIELVVSGTSATLAESSIELTDGSGKVALASGKLSVNNGALEVQ